MLEMDALILLYELIARAEIPEDILPPLPIEGEDQEPGNQVPSKELLFVLEVELTLVFLFCWLNGFVLEMDVALGSHGGYSTLSLMMDS